MSNYILKLYVTGGSARSTQAIASLRSVCDQLDDDIEVVVIDVLERPQLAEDEKIIATPTVIRELPLPVRRVIGDLSEMDNVLLGLDLLDQRPVDTTR